MPPPITLQQTKSGMPFALMGEGGADRAPLLLVLGGEKQEALGTAQCNKVGHLLADRGVLCASVDVPSHGEDQRPGEPEGLEGWRARLDRGEDFVSGGVMSVSAVLDHLIDRGDADPGRISVAGTSRGGFLALHAAAADERIRRIVAFAPVTDLPVLKEFRGLEEHALTRSLALHQHVERLVDRELWACIGNADERVGTDRLMSFVHQLAATNVARGLPAKVELHVMPSAGHRIHDTAHEEAAQWLSARI